MITDELELTSAKVILRAACDVYLNAGELPVIECITPKCRAVIALQGAQILSFCPSDGHELLWLSPLETFEYGKAIRGGIPLCLPWFGVNRREPALAKHGFARNQSWSLDNVTETDGGDLALRFLFQPSAEDLQIFPWAFSVQLDVLLSDTLALTLSVLNSSDKAMPLSFAMHSYFAVSGLSALALDGFDGAEYLDNCQNLKPCRQEETLRFSGEIDRVYEGLSGTQTLRDGARAISVKGTACDTVVVWNPGAVLADTIADVGAHFTEYVCVERGMAFADELMLAPGQRHEASMTLAATST